MRVLRAAAFLVLAGVVASPAMAQYGRHRDGRVWSPYGLMYDTRSPEWRMAGGNIYVYQELMQQKALVRQQQMVLKQQQAYAKQMQAAQKAQQRNAGGQNRARGVNGARGGNAANAAALNGLAGGGNGAVAGAGNGAGKRPHRTKNNAGKTKSNTNADLADDPVPAKPDSKTPAPAPPGEATGSAEASGTPNTAQADRKTP